ncbi:hypothetical protein SAY87_024086 [Trapa incisa]|uniref:Uncharacterized protein n=2 Tax=Trapa TaxID=22665 RepID=A0AAN7QG41_TRANT|nr:hypothetical protein SAY86_014598 [Trapa natans]KAK4776125.1 hypothetical protein SAY87_024086 [Trapa incisa]
MGNCFTLPEKVLAGVEGQHAISKTVLGTEYLQQGAWLEAGRSYNAVPLITDDKAKSKKKKEDDVTFADQAETEGGTGESVVRVKLVITRRELQEMLEEGAVSVDSLDVSHAVYGSPKRWKPVLKSIPEGKY